MLVNLRSSQQSCKEEYKPWKWDATARYYASHTKTMSPTRSPCQDPAGDWTHENLLSIVKRYELQWYGHVSRSSGLAKTILQGTVKGGRRRGRQKKMWEDNIREWTGLEFAKSQRALENREKWRKLAVKSSVVPQWPSRLRDRWCWWCYVEVVVDDTEICCVPGFPFTQQSWCKRNNNLTGARRSSILSRELAMRQFIWQDTHRDNQQESASGQALHHCHHMAHACSTYAWFSTLKTM